MKPIFLFLMVTNIFILSSCKKKDPVQDDCSTWGGIIQPDTYRFWTALPMYNTTVEVKDNTGNNVVSFYTITKIYYILPSPGWQPDACTFDHTKEAVFELYAGKHYTYKATNGSQTWTGAINVPCEQNICHNIEIK